MKTFIYALLLAGILIPAVAQADNSRSLIDSHLKWFSCEDHDDCTVINTPTGHCVGVNKNHTDDLTKYFVEKSGKDIEKTPCKERGELVGCYQNTCQLVQK